VDEDIKRGLKKIARNTETMLAESVLRWKHKKEGKKIPNNQELENRSRAIADQAHKIISKRGKNIWKEFKKAYQERQKKEGHSD
jgi:hypothetical protein